MAIFTDMCVIRVKRGGCDFFRWFDPESSTFGRQLLLDLRDKVRSLSCENTKLREALSHAKAELEMEKRDQRAERRAMQVDSAQRDELTTNLSIRIGKLESERFNWMCVIAFVFVVVVTWWVML